jgi:hypothetical protein
MSENQKSNCSHVRIELDNLSPAQGKPFNDESDMRRMGKKQEFRVGLPLSLNVKFCFRRNDLNAVSEKSPPVLDSCIHCGCSEWMVVHSKVSHSIVDSRNNRD